MLDSLDLKVETYTERCPDQVTTIRFQKEEIEMADETNEKKCAHPSCSCTVAQNEKYCSEYCANARNVMEISCNCRHPACS
ncbi:MAG: hypothetical protein H0V88_04750 [Pyrinomonadaceae bacterium]|nr:hypothetical protein [Pyrinomonadaceae bacterium]